MTELNPTSNPGIRQHAKASPRLAADSEEKGSFLLPACDWLRRCRRGRCARVCESVGTSLLWQQRWKVERDFTVTHIYIHTQTHTRTHRHTRARALEVHAQVGERYGTHRQRWVEDDILFYGLYLTFLMCHRGSIRCLLYPRAALSSRAFCY